MADRGMMNGIRASSLEQPSDHEKDIWEELHVRQQALLASVAGQGCLCGSDRPDRSALTTSRWRTAQAARARMDYLMRTVLPAAEEACTEAERARIGALREETRPYMAAVAGFLARWPTEQVFLDWPTYQAEAMTFRATIVARVTREATVLSPIFRRMALASASDRHAAGRML